MSKANGFMEFERQMPVRQPVAQRLQHWGEFVGQYDAAGLRGQSARCMNCGVPFCHNGCPLGNLIPEFNDAVYRGDVEEAYHILSSTNNFPEFTGRVCPAPCESACVLGINQSAVAIEEIEKHIIEIAFEQGVVQPAPVFYRSGKKVAVVGSGPAGLAAAAQLNLAGHSVTVFERDAKPGGLLRYGIPDFKLEKSVVDRRIRLMEAEGIVFRCGLEVGRQLPVQELSAQFDAIVLAGGATVPRDLDLPGRELEGVHFAMTFLKQQNEAVDGLPARHIDVKGKHVVVIGGGDTGSDCVGSANRLGAASVTQLELLPQPPATRNADMPWPTHPQLFKVTSSHEEGCRREFAVGTKAFIGDEQQHLRGLQIADLLWEGKSGFVEKAGSERLIPCDLALLAMGFLHPAHEGMLAQWELRLDARGNVAASEKDYRTSVPGIFAAGDMRRGQSLVVWAIREGRDCAAQVDVFLQNNG